MRHSVATDYIQADQELKSAEKCLHEPVKITKEFVLVPLRRTRQG